MRSVAATGHEAPLSGRSIAIALLPLMAVVFVAYLVTGVAMPVLPVHVHERLGFGTFMVGLVAGTPFAATLISRLWAGRYTDVRGSKRAVLAGLSFAGAAGAVCLASTYFSTSPIASVAILIVGRAILGVMESFVITGVLSWGLTLGSPQNTGKSCRGWGQLFTQHSQWARRSAPGSTRRSDSWPSR